MTRERDGPANSVRNDKGPFLKTTCAAGSRQSGTAFHGGVGGGHVFQGKAGLAQVGGNLESSEN